MNIFYLHSNPQLCAEMHCDKHVCKMIIEYAQLLSTAHRVLDGDDNCPAHLYKIAHRNHPSTIWVRQHVDNYLYVRDLWLYLCCEYTRRYDKIHLTQTKLEDILFNPPDNITSSGVADPLPLCMPDEYKLDNPIDSYPLFYRLDKVDFATWKQPSIKPSFMEGEYA